VDLTTAKLPAGWQSRVVEVRHVDSALATAACLDKHDLVISKQLFRPDVRLAMRGSAERTSGSRVFGRLNVERNTVAVDVSGQARRFRCDGARSPPSAAPMSTSGAALSRCAVRSASAPPAR